MKYFKNYALLFVFIMLGSFANAQISFTPTNLIGALITNPTSIQYGPDGRLYVAERRGIIKVFTVVRDSANSYSVTSTETISKINDIPNRNDTGAVETVITTQNDDRQITGIYVAGTALNPILYVSNSDERESVGFDKGFDTNSGIISKLTWNGSSWDHLDLVRGLPRSEENHSVNGLQLDAANNILYITVGGITNMGAPSINFGLTPEYALSAAILSIDLNVIEALPTQTDPVMPDYKYDLPTLDDEDRSGAIDENDPFGGNNGKNQAIIVPGGPVQVFSPGWRNPYDLVITESGNFFSVDNGPNSGWGGIPLTDSLGNCLNTPSETDSYTHCDQLHYIPSAGYHAGHPNPTRGYRGNTFNDTIFYNGGLDTVLPQTPIPPGFEDSFCDYRMSPLTNYCSRTLGPFSDDGAIALAQNSTNGICEYTASNFNGELKGDLLAAELSGVVYRFNLDSTGTNLEIVNGQSILFSNFGNSTLDITAQGDADIFAGTVWACNFGSNTITVFEPDDMGICDTTDLNADADSDGYTNGDEILNGTNPCSAGDQPADFDNDNLSDLIDGDDDNDGINDTLDLFAQDSTNGVFTTLPISYQFDNSNDKGIQGWGFTGLMTDNRDYLDKYDLDLMTVGGAAIKFTIDSASAGTATSTSNNQDYAFQFGLNVGNESGNYTIKARVMAPFSAVGGSPVNDQSLGMFIGTGDQDNYLKIVCHANSGAGGILVEKEELGIATSTMYSVPILGSIHTDVFLLVDPIGNTVQPCYSIDGGSRTNLGSPISISSSWIDSVLAVGLISTSGPTLGNGFPVTWDFIEVYEGPLTSTGNWYNVPHNNTPTARHENSFASAGGKFYILGGRGSKPTEEYNPLDSIWTSKTNPPIEMHHFQAVELDGLIYVVGALTGNYPNETPIPNVYIYNPLTDVWTIGKEIPANRRRGAAAAVVHNDKIYVAAGIVNGHISGTVNWFDVYDPYANTWDSLPDAPNVRDHVGTAISNNKLVLAGGRLTGGTLPWPTVPKVDIYDFNTNLWSTLSSPAGDIPTERAGCSAVCLGDEVIIIGGESGSQSIAHNETEALNVNTLTWRTLDPLITGRHGTQAIVSNNGIYTVCGSGSFGGAPELSSMEAFYFDSIMQPDTNLTSESLLLSTPSSANFGQILTNSSQAISLTINNTNGNQASVINNINISGDSEFSIDTLGLQSVPFILAPGQSISIGVIYNPLLAGVNTAILNIASTGLSSPFSVSISGEGVDTLNSAYRINAGGSDYIINSGDLFVADDFFTGGITFSNLSIPDILNTIDDSLYYSERSDSIFSYNFPIVDSTVLVKLHFAELFWGATGGAGGPFIGKRVFDVIIEGDTVLNDFDINAEAGNPETAVVRDFIISNTDSVINIEFIASVDNAKISAIEVIGGTPTLMTWYLDNDNDLYGSPNDSLQNINQPVGYVANNTDCNDSDSTIYPGAPEILDGLDNDCDTQIDEGLTNTTRINSGGPDYVSNLGNLFSADNLFSGGSMFSNYSIPDILNTNDDTLYHSERSGVSFSYNIPATDSNVLVRLHFAEIFWGATGGGGSATPGKRVFDVVLEGDTVLNDFDIILEAGNTETAIFRDFNIPNTDSIINIEFIASVDQAKISAIEILSSTPPLLTWFVDNDNDLFGNSNDSIQSVSQPIGYVLDNTDCDDSDSTVYPAAPEIFDGKDNNCNGQIDEGFAETVRINSGGPDHVVSNGDLFDADYLYTGGMAFDNDSILDIQNTIDDSLYLSERSGVSFSYSIPVSDTNNLIRLHFAEIYWGAINGAGLGVAGERVFDVVIEGDTLLNDFDIIAEAGASETAVIKDLYVSTSDFIIDIEFVSVVDQAKVSAIEVMADTGAIVCIQPTGLFANNITTNSAVINWNIIPFANNFEVRIKQNSDSVWNSEVIPGSPNSQYTADSLNQNTSYDFQLRSLCSDTSGWSDTIVFVTDSLITGPNCLQPFNLTTINESSTTTRVSWDSTVTADSWRVRYRKATSQSYTTKNIPVIPGDNSYLIENLVPDTDYYVWVRSICPGNNSAWSDSLLFTTDYYNCLTPDSIYATDITTFSAQINWDKFSTGTQFVIRYAIDTVGATNLHSQPSGTPNTQRIIKKLFPNTSYRVIMRTRCPGNFNSPWSTDTLRFTTLPYVYNCLQPVNIQAINIGEKEATIVWDSTSTADLFRVRYRILGSGSSWKTKQAPGTPNHERVLPNLTSNTTYETQVLQLCTGGFNGKWSGSVVFTTLDNTVYNCLVPSINSITNLSSTGATIGWSTASTAPKFEIRHTETGLATYTNDTVTGNPVPYNYAISGLSPSTTYDVEVRALCVPPSNWSTAVTFTTNSNRLIPDYNNKSSISINAFPNPTHGNVELQIYSIADNYGSLKVSDITGRSIYNEDIKLFNGENYITIDLSSYKEGIYLITMEVEGFKQYLKIIRN